jgi:hypothetical protein
MEYWYGNLSSLAQLAIVRCHRINKTHRDPPTVARRHQFWFASHGQENKDGIDRRRKTNK